MKTQSVVILGGGLTGASAAAALRKLGFDGRVTIVGEESELPYERPSLSKDYLRGESERSSLDARPGAFYGEQDIDVRTGVRAVELQPADRRVVLDDGSTLEYDRVLIATGSSPRPLDIPGANLPGVHLLRTVADADSIRAAAATASRVVVVGGGWIGSEVAASLRQLGHDVTLVARGAVPLEPVLGPEVGAIYADLHRAHGTTLAMHEDAVAFHGTARVKSVELKSGSRIPADLVVIGVGAAPRTELAAQAGLLVGNGIEVSDLQETSAPGVYAAGDVAAAWHPVFGVRVRVEHWDNAKRQGAAAAASMMGQGMPYSRVPYFYSDQFDLSMEYSGYAPTWDRVLFRGDPASGSFIALWLDDGRLVAGMNANVKGANKALAAIVASRRPVSVRHLVDPDVPLDDLEAVTDVSAAKSAATSAGSPS